MKKKTISKARKNAWKQFSRWIRLRDAKDSEYVACCTCGIVKHWKQQQAGHFIPQAQGNAVRFDERSVHVQCYRCNINLGGNGPEYYPYMLERYGQEVIDDLKLKSNQTVKFTVSELEEMEQKYKRLADEIESGLI